MDTIKLANKVLKDGVTLLPDEAKGDFIATADKEHKTFIYDAINNACGMVNKDEERIALLTAYAVQEANRVVGLLWREQLLTPELEAEYRKLPKMKEVADAYAKFEQEKQAKRDEINKVMQKFAEEQKELDIFKGVINGMSADTAKKEYEAYQKQARQAMQQGK